MRPASTLHDVARCRTRAPLGRILDLLAEYERFNVGELACAPQLHPPVRLDTDWPILSEPPR